MEETLYTRNNLLIAFLIGLIIGLGGYYLWDNRPGAQDDGHTHAPVENTDETENNGTDNTENGDTNGENSVEMGANSVQAPDQPAGLRVIIENATLDQSSWIAIHEDADGSLSPVILGAARYDAGEYTDEVVNLLRNTEEGNTYYAVVHADDGDKEFDPEDDAAVTGSQDTPIVDSFNVVPVR